MKIEREIHIAAGACSKRGLDGEASIFPTCDLTGMTDQARTTSSSSERRPGKSSNVIIHRLRWQFKPNHDLCREVTGLPTCKRWNGSMYVPMNRAGKKRAEECLRGLRQWQSTKTRATLLFVRKMERYNIQTAKAKSILQYYQKN